MDLTMIIVIVILGFIILAIGGGIGYWIFLASRTKKMIWNCKVYQKSDGIVEVMNDKGEKQYILDELKPYTEDVIEKIDKKNGATHYWLQKMKKATPVVTADCVEVWGSKKEVKVLLDGDTCTLLKSGYDKQIGAHIFRPIPHDRINMIKTELSERKERIQDKKDILAAITPFVVVGITMIALVIATYIIVQGALQSAEQNRIGSVEISESLNSLSNAMLVIYGYNPQDLNNTNNRQITKETVPTPMPP